MLSKLSIRAKLVAVVSFLLVATLGVGLLGLRQMNEINANLEDVRTNWLPSVRVIGELRAGVITYRNV
uniref:Tar ligand binding domain-containing protein n=1 Tax=Klebsiella pneumoniae TaxID=573 RepID=UPI001D0EA167